MVNFGLNPASLLGILLAIAGAGLYVLRSVRPELSRDQDIAFTAIGIICGFILIFQGWRLDPILQFGQFLLSGSAIFFAYESIKMRGIATEQAKEKTQIIDDDRPVSRRYKAEIEDREYLDDRPRNSRRIRGDEERRSVDNRQERDDLPRRRSATRQLIEDSAERTLRERIETDTSLRRRRREIPDRGEGSSLVRRSTAERWDSDDDWNESEPVRTRRALPDADRPTTPSDRRSRQSDSVPPADRASAYDERRETRDEPKARRRDRTSDIGEPDVTPRRRPRPPRDPDRSRDVEGTMASYVDYEPIPHSGGYANDGTGEPPMEPPSGLPTSSTEPIVFPDRY